MPRWDGTGPRGQGPLTGRGAGYCAIAYPEDREPYGYAGAQGRPVNGQGLLRWLSPFRYFGRGGRGRRARRLR